MTTETLPPGLHYTEVLAFENGRVENGPVFRIPVTVCKPEPVPMPGATVEYSAVSDAGSINVRRMMCVCVCLDVDGLAAILLLVFWMVALVRVCMRGHLHGHVHVCVCLCVCVSVSVCVCVCYAHSPSPLCFILPPS